MQRLEFIKQHPARALLGALGLVIQTKSIEENAPEAEDVKMVRIRADVALGSLDTAAVLENCHIDR